MKNLLLACSMLLYCVISLAQKTVLTYTPEIDKTADKKAGYESFLFTDPTSGKTAVVLKKGQSVEYLLLNKDQAIEAKVVPANGAAGTIYKAQSYIFRGGFMGKKGACFYVSVKDKDIDKAKDLHLMIETVDFAKNSISSKMVDTKDFWIESFVIQQNYYQLKVNEDTKEIVLYKIDENGNVTSKGMAADLKGFNREKISLYDYFSYHRVYYPGQETELPASTDLTKIYPCEDKITILVTNQAELPHIWTIDLKTTTLTRKKLELPGFAGDEGEGKKRKANNNSFILNNNIFVLNNNKEKIEIGIFDLSGKLLKRQEITEADMANFVDMPMEIMDVGRKHRENKIESLKELTKELSKGTTGIAVARTSDGNLMLTCGIYDSEVRTGSISNSTGSFGPTNITRTTDYQMRITRTVAFKMLLNPADFSVAKTKSATCSFDKINEYTRTLPEKVQAGNWYDAGNKKYYSYYNPEKSVFAVQEVVAGK